LSVRTFAAIPIIAVALAGCSGSDQTVSPADFVTAHAQDAQSVIAAVRSVDTGIHTVKDAVGAGGDGYAMVKLDGVLNDAQSTFDRVNKVLLTAAKPKGVESSGTEMCSATDKLSASMKTLRAYIDDKKPSELADHKKQWDTGRAWWNQAVTAIWSAASTSPLPTMENAPTAPPAS
jgi:hypothetical protein